MPACISLFTGAGGLDYGFEAAGFETRVAIDNDTDSCRTLRTSRNWPVIESDIHAVPSRTILQVAGLKEGEADALIAGPPCQPFSKSGWWSTGTSLRLDDPRAGTIGEFLRVLGDTLPRSFILENVEGLAYSGRDDGYRFIEAAIVQINRERGTAYEPQPFKVNSADYGVPQTRQRVIVAGHRDGKVFKLPDETHAPPSEAAALGRKPWVTAWDAIGHMRPGPDEDLRVRGKWANLLPSIPEGHNYLWHTDRLGGVPLFGWRRRYWSFLLKLAKDRPAWTIQAQPGPATGPFHWENRRLSIVEMLALQTFPRNVRISGDRASAQRQLGNAVPSLMAELLAIEVLEQLLGLPRPNSGPTLVVPHQGKCPPPEPIEAVPDKYRRRAGVHAAHPGTGRGYLYKGNGRWNGSTRA